jgi:hypothetical protein
MVSKIEIHRGVHGLAFAGVAFLLLALSKSRHQEIRSAIAVCLLGLSLEYLQHLIYRNGMEWWDVRDDTLAIFAVFALYQLTRVLKSTAVPPS